MSLPSGFGSYIWFLFVILRVQNLEPLPCNRNLDRGFIHGSDGRPCPYISNAFIMSSRPLGEIFPRRYSNLWSAMCITRNGLDRSIRSNRHDLERIPLWAAPAAQHMHVGVQKPEPFLCRGDSDSAFPFSLCLYLVYIRNVTDSRY
jgi:hypothetical protein